MKLFKIIFSCLIVANLFCSCDKDNDSWADNYQMSFLDFKTNADGFATRAVSDDDEWLEIDNPVSGLKGDTTYRYIAIYTRSDQHIKLSQCSQAFSPRPVRRSTEDSLYTDPVEIQSVWKVKNYINATLLVANKGKQHVMGFVHQETTTNDAGQKIAHIQLYHNNNGDIASYNSTAYLSLPLFVYADSLTAGRDSIYFSINTTKGNKVYPFLF